MTEWLQHCSKVASLFGKVQVTQKQEKKSEKVLKSQRWPLGQAGAQVHSLHDTQAHSPDFCPIAFARSRKL